MKNLKAMIVDDSGFSIMIIKKLLTNDGVDVKEVCKNSEEALEKIKNSDIDFITMDITLPDGSGVDLTEKLLSIRPDVKIIGISAMKDSELEKKAKDSGMKALLQKPVDEGEIRAVLEKLFYSDRLYVELKENFHHAFRENFQKFVHGEIDPDAEFKYVEDKDYQKRRDVSGFLVNIGIIGRFAGRMMIDMPFTTAENAAKHSMGEDIGTEEKIGFLNEFANIVAGNSVSMLNSFNRAFSLRVSPPTLIHGEKVEVSTSEIPDSISLMMVTKYGNIFMNVGFMRGDEEWTQN